MPIVLAVGDLAMDRDDYDECFAATREVLRGADLTFGQLETSFAETGERAPQARHAVLARPEGAAALGRAGFDVISVAGNHCKDWGSAAFAQTRANLERAGVATVGGGENIAQARRPHFATLSDGTRVAMLAYCSILPQSYWAEERRDGCAPMRAHTLYEQVEHDQPGTRARVHTYAHRGDLAAMQHDIEQAKAACDLVFVSQHWGLHFVRAQIADYEREVARAAISAGADAVIGGHQHILKGCDVIDGKPVFHGLCNFATDLRMDEAHASSVGFQEIRGLAEEWEPDFGSLYNFPTASRLAMAARFEIVDGRIRRAGALPVTIGRDAIPRFNASGSEGYREVLRYLTAVTQEAGLGGRYVAADDMIELELSE